jgi:tetratricopeptide (TPR) repeat protein
MLASLANGTEKADRAKLLVDQLIRLRSDYAPAYCRRSLLLGLRGDASGASADAESAVRLAPRSADALATRAFAHFAAKRTDEALRDLDQSIRQDPRSARALNWRGAVYGSRDDWMRALEDFEAGLAADPDNLLCLINRAQANKQLKRLEAAAADYARAAERSPGCAREALDALWTLKRHAEAIELGRRALGRLPRDGTDAHWVTYWLIRHLVSGGQHEDGLRLAEESLQRWPACPECTDWGARALYYLKRYEDSLKGFEEVTRLKPGDADAWANRAIVQAQLGRYKEALVSIREAIRLVPAKEQQYADRIKQWEEKARP